MHDRASDMVKEFHEVFGGPIGHTPQLLDYDLQVLRIKLFWEEFREYIEATVPSVNLDSIENELFDEVHKVDNDVALPISNMIEAADALADMQYILSGTAICHGFDLDALVAEVHRSNMTKLDDCPYDTNDDGDCAGCKNFPALHRKPILRDDGKIMKGRRYEPPRLDRIILGKE